MNELLSFDDVLIKPRFSMVKSRRDVDVNTFLDDYFFPVISSNMDTVTGPEMANAMAKSDAKGCLHRFWSIDENVKAFQKCKESRPWVSIGLGQTELDRASALKEAGATTFVIDVAHGASIETVNQTLALYDVIGLARDIVVGNFATADSINAFIHQLGSTEIVSAFKVGIGGGSACLTRVVTGCGMPTLASILDCAKVNKPIIADGGIRTSGDVAKALAAGASAVMLGGMLAGTDESSGELYTTDGRKVLNIENNMVSLDPLNDDSQSLSKHFKRIDSVKLCKKYRGSASQESYVVQNKDASWRTAEGESFLVPYKGPVSNVLQQIEGGLRSAFSYVGANNLREFQRNAELVKITQNGYKESGAHGKSS